MSRLARTAPAPKPGVVHFGLGAFVRAHVALYLQAAMERSGGDWGMIGVSLKRPDIRDQLKPQDFTYTAVELGPQVRTRHVQLVSDVLVAPESPAAVLAALDAVSLVTMTVTEKGYCHTPSTGRLNLDHPEIAHDLAHPGAPQSLIGFLVAGLAARRAADRPPFSILPCDNIPSNGRLVRGLVLDFAHARDPALADWIAQNARFPSSMVDSIVPATTDADLAMVEDLTGFQDAAPVMHEAFRQWVVEDDFAGPRPDLAAAGVELVADVTPYEHMKLRMLNGTHSSLAYLGYLAGAETVADTVARPAFADFVHRLWSDEIIPVLTPPRGADLATYAGQLFDRYANPRIRHRTWQIAMDGSQKLPQRILGTVAENFAAGRTPRGLILAIAAWMQYTSGRDLAGAPIDVRDPLAADLADCWQDGPDAVTDRYLAIDRIFPSELASNPVLRRELSLALERLRSIGAEAALAP